jgi:hypothetical protein
MQKYHFAQVNISKRLEPIDSFLLSDFVAQLDAINLPLPKTVRALYVGSKAITITPQLSEFLMMRKSSSICQFGKASKT